MAKWMPEVDNPAMVQYGYDKRQWFFYGADKINLPIELTTQRELDDAIEYLHRCYMPYGRVVWKDDVGDLMADDVFDFRMDAVIEWQEYKR
jgi:hypothetical protein